MRRIKACLNASVAGHDFEVEFEVEDSASDDEIAKIAWEILPYSICEETSCDFSHK